MLSDPNNLVSSLVMMHLSFILIVVDEKLKFSLCRELNFLSTITVLSLLPLKLPKFLPKFFLERIVTNYFLNLLMLKMTIVEGC